MSVRDVTVVFCFWFVSIGYNPVVEKTVFLGKHWEKLARNRAKSVGKLPQKIGQSCTLCKQNVEVLGR